MNPILQRLGFGAGDRVVLIHADDLGMCQATVSAFTDLVEAGLVSTGSAMVPCPWFPEVAALGRRHPELDLGAHLTLTSEWEGCRWGPVSTRDPASGLLDSQGYFHARRPGAVAACDPEAVRREIRAQVESAGSMGLDVTHADTHMLVLLAPRLLPLYQELVRERALPAPILRPVESLPPPVPGEPVAGLSSGGLGVCDHWVTLRLREPGDRLAQARRLLDGLAPGLTQLSIHPARDTPELRAIAPDWPGRVADYEVFRSRELREHARRTGIQVIGYRAVRAALRG